MPINNNNLKTPKCLREAVLGTPVPSYPSRVIDWDDMVTNQVFVHAASVLLAG
jgi:hypothetical protein